MANHSVEGARNVDREAIEAWGMPGLVLMENAARAVESAALDLLPAAVPAAVPAEMPGKVPGKMTADVTTEVTGEPRIVILCGGGNNGGDGWAVARHLDNRRAAAMEPQAAGGDPEPGAAVPPAVLVVVVAEPREGSDAAVNARIARRMGIETISADDWIAGESASESKSGAAAAGPAGQSGPAANASRARPSPALFIDAILGTGADRPLVGRVRALVEAINAGRDAGVPVLAVDVPTGFDADRGCPVPPPSGDPPAAADAAAAASATAAVAPADAANGAACAVRANVTVSFLGPKVGMTADGAAAWTGRVLTGDIGVPQEVVRRHASAPVGIPSTDRG